VPGPPPITQYDDEILALYDSGLSPERISKQLPISVSTIRRRLRAHKVPFRGRGTGVHRRLPHDEYERTVRLYVDEKLSIELVAQRLGLSDTTVYHRLRRAGVLRPRGEAISLSYRTGRRPPREQPRHPATGLFMPTPERA
jgi:DNA invertase Pin-like site-specific DNA recombinase